MNNYEDFLKISNEIKLEQLINEFEKTLLVNEILIKTYDEEDCYVTISQLYNMIFRLEDLKNHAISCNSYEVYDQCNHYILKIEEQMKQIREKYM
jgi:hypothetical protein